MSLKEYVINEMIEHLKDMEGVNVYACDLGYEIFESANVDCTYTYSTYEAIQWVKEYFEDLGEVIEQIKFDFSSDFIPNVFDEPEKFQVVCMLEISNYLIGQCDFCNKNWNDEVELNKKNIKTICKQLEELKYTNAGCIY